MNKNKFKIYLATVLASLLVSCSPVSFSKTVAPEVESCINVDFFNKYIYIDNENSLCLKDKTSNSTSLISQNILEFKNSNEFLAFIQKDTSGKKLKICDIKTGETTTVKDYYNEDFLVKDEYLFYVENNSIYKLNLNSKENSILVTIGTNDVVLNLVTDESIIFSYIKQSTPTTFSYNFHSEDLKEVAKNVTNIVVSNNVIYGLDSNLNLFKINKDNTLDTVSNYPILKFTINNDYLVYIDTNGSLTTLDSKGIKRIISDSAIDFKRIEDKIYYISASKENTIFETQLTGRHKNIIIDNANTKLSLSSIN